jgi:hypothetical protein
VAGIGRASLLAALAAAVVLAAPGTASADSSCEVGQPAAHEPPTDEPILSEVLVIGCGQALSEPVEIAAYETEDWLCIQVHQGDIEGTFSSCPHGRPPDGGQSTL